MRGSESVQQVEKREARSFKTVLLFFGAGGGIRTLDLLITNQLLYP